MTLARGGIVVAVAGGIALAGHARLLAKQAQQRSDCAAWGQARQASLPSGRWSCGIPSDRNQEVVATVFKDGDMQSLWNARQALACDPKLVWMLVPALRDPTFVGLRNSADTYVWGREMPSYGHGMFVEDDLFTRAGRASWLLKEATGHHAPDVGMRTDPLQRADIARDWQRWLEDLDARACRL
jgi:hypothetical protein